MIRQVNLDMTPMRPGESRFLVVFSDTSLNVEIRCHTDVPPPPGYKPCPACGSLSAQSGQEIPVIADAGVFRDAPGHMEIEVADLTGDRRHLVVPVQR
jgi:hypothetical protein